MIEVDGSFGEGGGQILRTALSLSCLFKKPFRLFNIRKGRKKPGLMPQHLTCVRASQIISDAKVIGDHAGSQELVFSPSGVKSGEYFFDVGTAGSTSLVIQTIIPPLIFSKGKSTVTLKGGTHVPFSPPFHYISEVFIPALMKFGIEIYASIESCGFYPRGGGKVKFEILPARDVKPLNILHRGDITGVKGYSAVGNLPLSIAERQKKAFLEKLYSELPDLNSPADIEIINAPAYGHGTFIFLKAESENSIAGFSSLGERGKKAEKVGEDAAQELINYSFTEAAFDLHLADQIVLYLSMSKEKSVFTTSSVTGHLMTNLWVIGLFNEFRYDVEGEMGMPGKVRIN